eukprot:Opistho-1_new@54521
MFIKEDKMRELSLATPLVEAPFGTMTVSALCSLNDEAVVPEALLRAVARPSSGSLTMIRSRGTGGQGRCIQMRDNREGRELVVKQVSLEDGLESSRAQALAREALVLNSLSHPNIIRSYGVQLEEQKTLGLQLEVMDCTLREYVLRAGGSLDEDSIRRLLRQLLSALAYIHENNVVHLDVKPENILIKDGDLRLADFGLARVFTTADQRARGSFSGSAGTFEYMAPEAVKRGEYGMSTWTDVWAVGCVAVMMATGRNPWGDCGLYPMLQRIVTPGCALPIPPTASPAFAAFIARCLTRAPQDRPSAAALLQDPFLAQ